MFKENQINESVLTICDSHMQRVSEIQNAEFQHFLSILSHEDLLITYTLVSKECSNVVWQRLF